MFGTPVETIAIQALMIVVWILGVIAGAQVVERRKQ